MAKKILVVDDSSSIRQSVGFILEENGYEVDLAEDGVQGTEKLEAGEYDLVISDVNMPNRDGISMVKLMKAMDKFKFTPVLILTTESQKSVMEEGKKAGATGWIVKPFTNEKLLATVARVLG
jgi:two-component system chemotaxis response regulator CheY